MINLSVQPYCENCMDFEAEVKKIEYVYGSGRCYTEITCRNKSKCESIMRYLQEERKGE